MPSPAKKFAISVRVYLEDTDAQGVVYNASYFRFMERARTERLRSMGVDHGECELSYGIRFVLASISAKFHQPSRLSDMLSVEANLVEIRGARMRFEQTVRADSIEGKLVCEGVADVACMDTKTSRPTRFPKQLVKEWS